VIVTLMNFWDAWKFHRRNGYWCDHPKDMKHGELIDLGRRKMFWCTNCGGNTEFV
jgi:hypothetical protein